MFKSIAKEELLLNPLTLFDKHWCLISAKAGDRINTMTASWGGLGTLWHRPVATIYVRHSRYTHELLDASDTFTLSFFSEEYHKTLSFLGAVSGRDRNKIEESGLKVVVNENAVYFEEAQRVLSCRKLYSTDIRAERLLDKEITQQIYFEKDYHTIYIGEITDILDRCG